MKKLVAVLVILSVFLSNCGSDSNGELVGVQDREGWYEPEPYGMIFVPMGSFNMGPNDEDITFSMNAKSKTVSIDPFWIDETEITNNEYRQFVYWVRDSLARKMLGEQLEEFLITEDDNGEILDPPLLNWEEEIRWEEPEQMQVLVEGNLIYKKEERFYNRKEVDVRQLNYHYWWIDLKQAAKKTNRYNFKTKKYDGEVIDGEGNKKRIENRRSFIMESDVNVYPDTLVWMADYTYSYNEPVAKMYFWHAAFDDYPVVGVTWTQANAFCNWRTKFMNDYLSKEGELYVQDYRLPTEAEWEYAARGGLPLTPYPWGGPYTRNNIGCFVANFKPLRGNYIADGGIRTLEVTSYAPNELGIYEMAGNVAEWTSNAFNESAYSFTHDLNPDYKYNAVDDDPPVLKRKVVRGGSWKDIGYFLQTGSRTYEYQDTAKSYIGFRCVRSFMGRDINDWDGSQL